MAMEVIRLKTITKPIIRVKQQTIEDELKRYFELVNQVNNLKEQAENIKRDLRDKGIGVDEPQKFNINGIGKVKVSLKKAIREYLDKSKAKSLLPEDLYDQIRSLRKVESYEIRKVK